MQCKTYFFVFINFELYTNLYGKHCAKCKVGLELELRDAYQLHNFNRSNKKIKILEIDLFEKRQRTSNTVFFFIRKR